MARAFSCVCNKVATAPDIRAKKNRGCFDRLFEHLRWTHSSVGVLSPSLETRRSASANNVWIISFHLKLCSAARRAREQWQGWDPFRRPLRSPHSAV